MGEARRRRLAQDKEGPLTLERVQVGCELALLFMLWHISRDDDDLWYQICAQESVKYPGGSYRNVWWWAMRTLAMRTQSRRSGKTTEEELTDFRAYFAWKMEQYETNVIRRVGPKL